MKLCPHWFGWVYLDARIRRWCRVCGHEQILDRSTRFPYWRALDATELPAVQIERIANAFAEQLEAEQGTTPDGGQ